MLAMVRNRVSLICVCLGLLGLLSGCNPKDLYVSVTDRIYVPPPKPELESPRAGEAKAEAPPPMAAAAPAPPPPAPPEEPRVTEPPVAPPPPEPPPPAPVAPPVVVPPPPPPVVAAVPEPEMVSVPNVVGMPQDQAERVITDARLGRGSITLQQHKTVPAGHVISQDPAAGTRVPPGTPVHLVVSTGWPKEPAVSLDDVYFDYDRFAIRDDAKAALEANAAILKADASRKILIEGHCDERGTSDYNLVLGEKRARAAKQYLQDLGIDASRIQITSFGKEKPFCTEHNPTCWQSNRRAHFVLQ
jgi:peptidoglycan-associated lipoprotein